MTKLSEIAALVLLVALASASTCADMEVPVEDRCVVDEECGGDMFCYSGRCTSGCVSDEDCGTGELCRAELRMEQDDVVDVCVPVTSTGTNNGGGCDVEACVASLENSRARCGVDGFCYVPELVFGLLVLDATDISDPATSIDATPGADIAAIYLEDPESGAPVAWADTVALAPAGSVEPRNAPAGEPVGLTEDAMCVVAPYEEATTALGGSGGYLLVRFLEEGTRAPVTTPPEEWNIVVVEWGDNCGAAGDPDAYEIWACEAASFEAMDAGRDCVQKLGGPGGGRTAVPAMEK